MALLAIASLTVHEAARRRLLIAVAVASFALVALTGWGFERLLHAGIRGDAEAAAVELRGAFAMLVILMAWAFSVILALGAAFLAAPAIAGDVESGLLLAILPRPLRRADVVLGKWLALVTLVVTYAFAIGALELGVVDAITGYLPPHPAEALAYLAAESVVTLTLALFLSSRLAPITAGIVALALFGLAWVAGIATELANALGNRAVVHAATFVSLLVPSDGMWRSALYHLEPVAMLAAFHASVQGMRAAGPFGVANAPPWPYLVWTAGWIAVLLGATIASFRARDL